METIKNVSGRILKKLFELMNNEGLDNVGSNGFVEEFKLDQRKIDKAIRFLKLSGYVEGTRMVDGRWISIRLTQKGFETCQDSNKYKRHFNLRAGIPGIAEAEWGVEER